MALPACFHLADDVFPRVRAAAARHLVADGWSQTRTAKALAISQAMVSKHVAKAGDETDPLVLRLTNELLRSVQDPDNAGAASWCTVLAPVDQRPGAHEALQDLLAAERTLMDQPPLRLVPQIGLNLARASASAVSPADVLSFPARLVAAGHRLVSPVPPAWGASGHLAACLLRLRAAGSQWTAIANVRGGDAVAVAARAAGLVPVRVDRNGRTDDAPILDAFAAGHPVVHDPGAVGIEACLYVAAASAAEVARQLQSIHTRLTP